MEHRARVGDAAMRKYVCTRPHDRETRLGTVIANVVERELREHGGRLGACGVVSIEALAVGVKKERVPLAASQLAALRLGNVVVERLNRASRFEHPVCLGGDRLSLGFIPLSERQDLAREYRGDR